MSKKNKPIEINKIENFESYLKAYPQIDKKKIESLMKIHSFKENVSDIIKESFNKNK